MRHAHNLVAWYFDWYIVLKWIRFTSAKPSAHLPLTLALVPQSDNVLARTRNLEAPKIVISFGVLCCSSTKRCNKWMRSMEGEQPEEADSMGMSMFLTSPYFDLVSQPHRSCKMTALRAISNVMIFHYPRIRWMT